MVHPLEKETLSILTPGFLLTNLFDSGKTTVTKQLQESSVCGKCNPEAGNLTI